MLLSRTAPCPFTSGDITLLDDVDIITPLEIFKHLASQGGISFSTSVSQHLTLLVGACGTLHMGGRASSTYAFSSSFLLQKEAPPSVGRMKEA